jgi:SAM-dependent methyltransferase
MRSCSTVCFATLSAPTLCRRSLLDAHGMATDLRTDLLEDARRYWDEDAATYDLWREHGACSAVERAAWRAALVQLLPPCGAKLLDVGAGTGFLSLAAARMGYEVTALDISEPMLAQLRAKASDEGLSIHTVRAPAHDPPTGPFDAVMERMALWTLPDPEGALRAWREVTVGPLIALEGLWSGGHCVAGLKAKGRKLVHRVRRLPPEHHAPYPAHLVTALPMIGDTSPTSLLQVIGAAGWECERLIRLRDVEWARLLSLPTLDRMFGVTPEYAIAATRST